MAAAAAAAAQLLVRLSPAPQPGDKALLKLQSYFQSGKRSGGGECEVRPGPGPGTYWVQFQKEEGKRLRERGRCGSVWLGAALPVTSPAALRA